MDLVAETVIFVDLAEKTLATKNYIIQVELLDRTRHRVREMDVRKIYGNQ